MSDFIIPIRESRKRWKPSGIICQKLPHTSICQLAGISGNTLRSYLKEYQKGGIEKVKSINFYRPKSKLEAHKTTLKSYFEKNPPATIKGVVKTCWSL